MTAVERPRLSLTGGVRLMVERNLMIYRHTWLLLVAEILEPVLYLGSIGLGIGALVGHIPGLGGTSVRYPEFVAPALLATAAMNGAMNETAFLMYSRLTVDRVYEPILATPMTVRQVGLGEAAWAVLRGLLVSTSFLVIVTALGLIGSPWALLVVPGAAIIGFAFAAAGLVVVTYIRHWADFQNVQLVMLPMFLFATTFYPLDVYPRAVQIVVECLPLYQSIELLRQPALGHVGPGLLIPVVYLVTMGLVALAWALRRLRARLQH
ncbi:MAG TPA: ABC transporter permease [Gaiellaceae bacterium]|nr:ABC transporter permease [Gaiellaceae bacterium]